MCIEILIHINYEILPAYIYIYEFINILLIYQHAHMYMNVKQECQAAQFILSNMGIQQMPLNRKIYSYVVKI